MNNGVVRTAYGNDRGRRLLASKEPPYAKIQKYENDVDSEVGYETIPGGGGGVGRRRGNSEYDPGYEELAQPAPHPSSPRMPPNHGQVQDQQQQQQHQHFPDQSEDGNPEIELDNSVNSAGQSSLIHMSVQQSVTEVPDTPGFRRRSSVVVIEHVVEGGGGGVASPGVSDVDGHPADDGSPSAGDKSVHIFV